MVVPVHDCVLTQIVAAAVVAVTAVVVDVGADAGVDDDVLLY